MGHGLIGPQNACGLFDTSRPWAIRLFFFFWNASPDTLDLIPHSFDGEVLRSGAAVAVEALHTPPQRWHRASSTVTLQVFPKRILRT